jgi:hypothetical protein
LPRKARLSLSDSSASHVIPVLESLAYASDNVDTQDHPLIDDLAKAYVPPEDQFNLDSLPNVPPVLGCSKFYHISNILKGSRFAVDQLYKPFLWGYTLQTFRGDLFFMKNLTYQSHSIPIIVPPFRY